MRITTIAMPTTIFKLLIDAMTIPVKLLYTYNPWSGFMGSMPHALRIQVHNEYLLWSLTYVNNGYCALFGSPGMEFGSFHLRSGRVQDFRTDYNHAEHIAEEQRWPKLASRGSTSFQAWIAANLFKILKPSKRV